MAYPLVMGFCGGSLRASILFSNISTNPTVTAMGFKYSLILILLFLFYGLPVLAADSEALLFKDISRQSHDYSCGPAALSTLINGAIPGRRVSEMEVIQTRKKASGNKNEEGFSLLDLKHAAEKLGRRAAWRKIRPEILPKISQPVILLTGLAGPFPHFVILKGFRNGEAFLADPTRGNIRVPYEELMADGIDEEYPAWYVMAIDTPATPNKESSFYLSGPDDVLARTHFTIAQSDALTLVTIAKPKQILVTYGYSVSHGRDSMDGIDIKSRGDSHSLGASYGIGDDTEIGGGIGYSNSTYTYPGFSLTSTSSSRDGYLSISRSFDLAGMDGMEVLVGSTLSHSVEYDAFNLRVNAMAYGSTEYGQWMAGGAFYKKLKEKAPGDVLSKYGISWTLGMNKPLSDRYLGTFYLRMNSARNDGDSDVEFNHYYSANASLSWTMNKKIQLRPSVDYSFGGQVMETFSMGMEYFLI
uniref:Peptidase C39 family protein n=1 Tax=Candidatus Kentrum sp. LPFa TaxID=2126335 RepID=A0A450X0L1_9GAMM|nr:MAG: Peptidase C39 family protein [Candidatus Kentron sp. LPFa]VFK35651.1 MAG: Peptidase C39 family protein [Candidatus Kentron sp. LPFa]